MIPFNKPFLTGKEIEYIEQAHSNGHLAGGGSFSKRCQQWLEENLKCKKVLLTHSCTAALEMSALLVGLQENDEVIMPSFTFVSTANAIALRGAKPVFVDIDPVSLNIDPAQIKQAINANTKAIMPVHYAGVACDMREISNLAKANNLAVIEDAAQGILSHDNEQFLGTIGDLGALSFHETKNIIAGEGHVPLVWY